MTDRISELHTKNAALRIEIRSLKYQLAERLNNEMLDGDIVILQQMYLDIRAEINKVNESATKQTAYTRLQAYNNIVKIIERMKND